jgi:hypothetical protein
VGGPPGFLACYSISVVVTELRAVEAFVLRLLLLLVLRKQLLCAFLSLVFLCGMMPFFVVGVLPILELHLQAKKLGEPPRPQRGDTNTPYIKRVHSS